jgi:hypothetical protein
MSVVTETASCNINGNTSTQLSNSVAHAGVGPKLYCGLPQHVRRSQDIAPPYLTQG